MNPFEQTWQETSVGQPTYPPSLPHDVAVCMSDEELDTVRLKYALSPEEFDYTMNLPLFKREFAEWRQRLISEGNSFKLKLRAMSEEFLPTLHEILHSDTTAPSVKADIFKYITKVAELEPPKETSSDNKSGAVKLVIQWQDGSGQIALQTGNNNG